MLRRPQPPIPCRPRPRPRVPGGAVALLLAATLPVVLLSGCTAGKGSPGPSDGPSDGPGQVSGPGPVATALAAGIGRRDVSGVAFSGATAAEVDTRLRTVVAGMGSLRPAVTVGPVDQQDDRATATLRYSWTFPGVTQRWGYDTTATLVREGGAWKAVWQPALVQPGLDGSNRLSERRTPAQRGQILGQDGDAIVTERPVVRIGIDKTKVSGSAVAASAARLAKLVGINAKTYQAEVAAAGPQDFVEALVLRDDAADRPRNADVYAIPGAVPVSDDAMLAPTRDFARSVLGSVGPATAELVKAGKGQVDAGDEVGRSGLQRRYDARLRGTAGITVRLVPAASGASASPSASPSGKSTPASTVFTVKPVAGQDLATTLSIPLENLAEKILAKTKPASALVALRPSTGEVLVAANGPGSGDHAYATTGQFPPGSTFKVATSLALLRSGLQPGSRISCPSSVTVDGKKFTNYSDYPSSHLGTIDLRTALAQSCNTAFIGQRGRLSGTELARAAASLGVGTDYDVGFSSYFGSVPADPTLTGRAAAMIGQGQVLASPLAMASVAASVAAGRTVLPRLVAGPRVTSKAAPLTRDEAAKLQQMMAAVVSQGSGAVLQGLGGPRVLAKTGTAEFGPKPPFPTHAWMIAAHGDLAVAVFVDRGSSGSHTAGPLLREFLAKAR